MYSTYRLSKPSSRIVFSVPNETFFSKIKSVIKWLKLSSIILSDIEEGSSEWHLHSDFNEKKLRTLVSNRFNIIKVKKPYFSYIVMKVGKKSEN